MRERKVIVFNERLRYSIPEASMLLSQSRANTYRDIAAGTLRVVRDARRVYVPGTEIARRSRLDESE